MTPPFDWIFKSNKNEGEPSKSFKKARKEILDLSTEINAIHFKIKRAIVELEKFVELECYEEAARKKEAIKRAVELINEKRETVLNIYHQTKNLTDEQDETLRGIVVAVLNTKSNETNE